MRSSLNLACKRQADEHNKSSDRSNGNGFQNGLYVLIVKGVPSVDRIRMFHGCGIIVVVSVKMCLFEYECLFW